MKLNDYWRSILRDGLILGLAFVVILIAGWQLRLGFSNPTLLSMLNFLAMGIGVHYFTRRYALSKGDAGYSYGQCMGYIAVMSVVSGLILGIAQYMLWNGAGAEYFKDLLTSSAEQVAVEDTSLNVEDVVGLSLGMFKSAPIVIFSTIFGSVLQACFIGLVVSIFIKRKPVEDAE